MHVLIVASPDLAPTAMDCCDMDVTFVSSRHDALQCIAARRARGEAPFSALLFERTLLCDMDPVHGHSTHPDPLIIASLWNGIPAIAAVERSGTSSRTIEYRIVTIEPDAAWVELYRLHAVTHGLPCILTPSPRILITMPAPLDTDGQWYWDECVEFLLAEPTPVASIPELM